MSAPIPPLSPAAFAAALRKGQGRARLHVQYYGLDDVVELVLAACVHNQVYDQQCEDSRAPWLFAMFHATPHYARFRAALCEALATETNNWHLHQICGLFRAMIAAGDDGLRPHLHAFVLKIAQANGDAPWLGVEEWVALEGLAGVVELARLYGQQLLANPKAWVYDQLLHAADQDFTTPLTALAETDPVLRAYLAYVAERQPATPKTDFEALQQQRREQVRQKYSVQRILAAARAQQGDFPGFYGAFGRYALPTELEEIYAALLAATTTEERLRLLWVFRRVPLPHLHEDFFAWACGAEAELARAALTALAQVHDPRVYALGKEKVAQPLLGPNAEALDLFLHNYDAAVAPLITQALINLTPSPDEAHALGYDILALAEQHTDPALAAALCWMYEHTPCGHCRYQSVVRLDALGQLPAALSAECGFDAEESIRNFAQTH